MRTTVWVPDELMERVRAEHPDANVSAILQAGLRGLWSCAHDLVVCSACGKPLQRVDLERGAVERFWRALTVRLEVAVRTRQTAQGAAKVVRECAVDHGVIPAVTAPLPRPSRAEIEEDEWRRSA